jgi:plastocyanin
VISILKSKFAVLGFVMVALMLIPANDAFADHAEVTIVTVDESGFSQTCAASQGGPGCYTPVTATVDVGGVVTMTNSDPTGVHTFTSGTVNGFTPSPDGTFDSSVLMSGDSFEWIPESAGEVPYYCMLHTWMVGSIIVQEAGAEEAAAAEAAAAELAAEAAAAEAAAAELAAEAAAAEAEAAAEAAAVDTTPPVITIPELTTDQWGNENLELSMSGTTNFPTGSWTLDVTDNVGVADSACWANIMDDSSNPWISSTQSYDFSKITNNPSGQKFAIGPTSINCAAYDAAGNRSESNFRVVVTHDDPTGFVQYIDKPNSFGNTADSTTKIFYSAGSAQGLNLLKPIADLLTESNTQGMLARDTTRTLMNGTLTLDDNSNSFYTGGQYTVGNTGYGIELPKPLADMLTDANMAGIADRVNPTRSWSGNGWSVEISEDVSWLSPLNAMVKICNDQGGCQENHVMKPFADMLNESNLNQAMFERSNMKILDAGGPAASATQSSSADTTPPAPSNFASEISPIIGNANYFAQTNQQAHEFSGNTAKVYVTFNENVPTMGSLINIVSVFPNAQNNLPLHCPNMNSSQCLDIPYTLTYPGGVEEGTITGINTTHLYDMVLSINNPPVAGHYVFQTELISTSFDVYDPNTAEGQQAAQETEENMSSQISTITLEYVDQSDDRFFANESFTIQGNWNKPGQSNQPNTNQCHVWVSLNVYNSGGSYQQCTTSFPLYIMYYHPDTGTE